MFVIVDICLKFVFIYVYGIYCQFLIHSSCASLDVTNKANTNSPSCYFTYYTYIIPTTVFAQFPACKFVQNFKK